MIMGETPQAKGKGVLNNKHDNSILVSWRSSTPSVSKKKSGPQGHHHGPAAGGEEHGCLPGGAATAVFADVVPDCDGEQFYYTVPVPHGHREAVPGEGEGDWVCGG